jgi:hypothetical protein
MRAKRETLDQLYLEAAGIAVIAAAYVYFLIFAQFAFLHLAQSAGIATGALRTTMACMGISGFVSAITTGRCFRDSKALWLLRSGFLASALAAITSTVIRNETLFCATAAIIGCSLGTLTVTLAAALPRLLPRSKMGRDAGIGTGLAYAICNIPGVFAGSAHLQVVIAVSACGVGWLATCTRCFAGSPAARIRTEESEASSFSFSPLVVVFLVLVWLDSAAFFILQETPALNRFGWEGTFLQWSNAATHLAAAILAGMWLDRKGLQKVLLFAFAGLVAAILCMSSATEAAGFSHWLYTAGVSFYSTALVLVPSMNAGRESPGVPARRAGILYAVAGWLGSALGIGMAQDLNSIPPWFLWVAGGVFACNWGWRTGVSPRNFARRSLGVISIGAFAVAVRQNARNQTELPNRRGSGASLGKEVYVSEGCIHCHSQYVRPASADEIWWGPSKKTAEVLNEAPPLIGNRRQGPDLMNIGNRRSPAWIRLELMKVRALVPNSRMPSYAYLFAPGDRRGQALVAYLSSLGADTFEARSRTRESWHPGFAIKPVSNGDAAMLFQANCVSCHGQRGKGDGPLAGQLGERTPRDLTEAHWLFIPPRKSLAEHLMDLARVVKFGIPGTSMPGHETFTDAEALGMSAYIESLQLPPRIL